MEIDVRSSGNITSIRFSDSAAVEIKSDNSKVLMLTNTISGKAEQLCKTNEIEALIKALQLSQKIWSV